MRRVLWAVALVLAAGTHMPAHALPVLDQTGNILANGNFELGSTTPVTSGLATSAPSALDDWSQWANSSPDVTTRQSSLHIVDGLWSARVEGNTNSGLYQYGPLAAGAYTVSGWVYVLAGSAHLGIAWEGGSVAHLGPTASATGMWQYLETTATVTASLAGALVYTAGPGSDFLADGIWLNAGMTSTSPYRPEAGFDPNAISVPEPASLVLVLLALGGLRWRVRKPFRLQPLRSRR